MDYPIKYCAVLIKEDYLIALLVNVTYCTRFRSAKKGVICYIYLDILETIEMWILTVVYRSLIYRVVYKRQNLSQKCPSLVLHSAESQMLPST